MANDQARLFFGFDIQASWPQEVPCGKLILEKARHLTTLFLGSFPRHRILDLCQHLPRPPFLLGPAGIFTQCLFFPKRHAHCVAWEVSYPTGGNSYHEYRQTLERFFIQECHLKKEKRPHLPHVTICRTPFDKKAWLSSFRSIAFKTDRLHLYESLGNSTYRSLWSYPFDEAFTKVEHNRHLSFLIRGSSLLELYRHAELALAFMHAPLIGLFAKNPAIVSLDDLLANLNSIITNLNFAKDCPFKAVKSSGTIKERSSHILEWEMIVDVRM